MPSDLAVVQRRGEDVQIGVAIQVRGENRSGSKGRSGDHLARTKRPTAVLVLIPFDLITVELCRQHIVVSITIEIHANDRTQAARTCLDFSTRTEARGPS